MDWWVLAAMAEVRGAATGLVLMTEVVVVKADTGGDCEAVALETEAVWLFSLAAEETPGVKREGEKVVEKLGGLLGVGASLEGVVVLVLVESGRGVNLETGVFVGKSLRGAIVFVDDSDLEDRTHTHESYNHEITHVLTKTFENLIQPNTD